MNEEEIKVFEAMLVEIPFKYAQPIISFLSSKLKDEKSEIPSPDVTGNIDSGSGN
jgi:hypothetical protein